MILMPCLFSPALSYLPLEYFPLDICIIMLTLLHHLVLFLHSPGEYHLTPLDPHVQVVELGACDQSGAAVAWITSLPFRAISFQAPCVPLEFLLSKLVSALLFILILSMLFYTDHTCTFHVLYTVHICTFPCIPAFAHISDIIFM